ncbi:MAG: ribonuclease P protein component [Planctomycetes bacterium]|nr:ribonuclease P protein component [Planctomycetota bacterium]
MSKIRKNKFTKKQRLLKKKEFDEVFSIKNSESDQNVIIYIKFNTLQYNRLGIVIGKKVGNAVKRNRFKRIVREGFRIIDFMLDCTFDMVVLPRKPLNAELKSTDIMKSMQILVLKLCRKGKMS